MKVNTYGLKMLGLRKASGETKGLTGCIGYYIQISYDTESGNILTVDHYSLGQNSCTQYHSNNITRICNASSPMTMQEIADEIAKHMAYHHCARD